VLKHYDDAQQSGVKVNYRQKRTKYFRYKIVGRNQFWTAEGKRSNNWKGNSIEMNKK
jgi:hypothetical protein